MLMLLTTMMIIMMSLVFIQLNHPLAMGLILILQTTLTAMLTGMMCLHFWFSYILFLIFVGGMLVMFLYTTTLASNEMFAFPTKLFAYSLIVTTLTMTVLYLMDLTTPILPHFKSLPIHTNSLIMMNIKLYNLDSHMMTFMLIIYLFLTLIIIVNITQFLKGPLRKSY